MLKDERRRCQGPYCSHEIVAAERSEEEAATPKANHRGCEVSGRYHHGGRNLLTVRVCMLLSVCKAEKQLLLQLLLLRNRKPVFVMQ